MVSAILLKVCISLRLDLKAPKTLSSTLLTQIKNAWNTNPTLFYPTWRKWLFLAQEFKRSMYFYTCILHILYILSFWDFAEQMGFVQTSNIILITFFLLQSVHTMLYKSQKLSSKYDFWQYQLMLLKYIQTYMVILKSQGSMYVSVYPSANKLESISQ